MGSRWLLVVTAIGPEIGKAVKSTSSGMIWWGPYLISDFVKGQSVVATSSGEAELHAAVSAMKDTILTKRALSFIGMSAKMELRFDSSAARAMLERQGAGRVRHVEVAVLWAQLWVKDRRVAVRAEPTGTNCADLGTKVRPFCGTLPRAL